MTAPARRVDFLAVAEAELQAAAAWYAERDMKVARDFVSGVQRVTSLIARQPGLGAPWNDTRLSAPVRRVPLTRFPYQVISAAILFSWVHLSEIHAGHGSSRHGRRRA